MEDLWKSLKLQNKYRFPVLGQRIIKTAIAVFLCLMIYILRGYHGMVSQSTIAAIICMQPYVSDSKTFAINRTAGTLVGAFWGLSFLWLMEYVPVLSEYMVVVYLIMAIGIVLVFYCAVLFKTTDSASLAAIVFLCVIIAYPAVESPVLQTMDRIIDTIIGVCVSVFVNSFHLPRKKHHEKFFFLNLKDLTGNRYSQVPPRVIIELNRLYEEGARICLESTWAPAFVLPQLTLMKINLPVIVMDGAALYDVSENIFLDVVEIAKQDVAMVTHFLEEQGRGYCIFAVRENTMFSFLQGKINPAEEEDYRLMRRSPYRNYMMGDYHEEDKLTVIRTLVPNREANAFEESLHQSLIYAKFRIVRREQPRLKDYTGFYFYNPEANMSNMEKKLLDSLEDNENVIPVHVIPKASDYSPERDAPVLLRRVRDVYEPYEILSKIENWRTRKVVNR